MDKDNKKATNQVKRKRQGSFQLRLILIMSSLTVAVVLLTAGINLFNSIRMLQKNLEQESYEILVQIEDNIMTSIKDLEGLAKYFATQRYVVDLAEGTGNKDMVMSEFGRLKANYPDLFNVYMATSDKSMYIYPEQELPDDYDPTSRGWYQGAMANKGLYVSSPYIDAGSGSVVYTICNVIVDDEDNVIGVFALDVSMDQLAEKLNSITIGKTGYPVLIDHEGLVLTHQDPSVLGETLPIPELLSRILDEKNGTTTYTYKGDKKIGVFIQMEIIDTYILAAIPLSDVSSDSNQVIINGAGIAVLVIIVSVLIAYFVAKSITKHVGAVVTGLTSIKNGDLTTVVQVKTNDEFGRLAEDLNETVMGLKAIINEAKEIATNVGSGSETLADLAKDSDQSATEVSRTSAEIARGAAEQAEEAEDGARLTADLAGRIDHLTAETDEMKELAVTSKRSNDTGVRAVEELKQKSSENELSTKRVEIAISELDAKAKEIGNILDTITSIADQTNLLALNASIEAARAGEHGRGFAVVADEIRKLAEDSRASTEEIQRIVVNIQDDSNQTVVVMQEVMDRNQAQNVAVAQVTSVFNDISDNIQDIVNKIDRINEDMIQMNESKNQIVSSITNISAISEETAAASEEVTASMETQSQAIKELAGFSDQLKEMAEHLVEAFTRFKI